MSMKNDNNKTLRISFQAVIIGAILLNLLNLDLPSESYSGRAILLIFGLIISCAILIYIMIRVCFKNVKKWEMILYNVLNLICVYLIIYCIRELAFEKVDWLREHAINDEAYDDAEGVGLSAMFAFVLLGMPTFIMTLVFTIIGIVMTCIKKEPVTKAMTDETEIVQSTHTSQKINNNQIIRFCRNCGCQTDIDAKFCRYCGKPTKQEEE